MPKLNVTTKSAQQVWASPDGQRVISEVILDYQGKQFKAKTYSKSIAVPGWSGEIDTEERPGRNGPETFVKQPPKEGGFGSSGGGFNKGGKTQDAFAMYLSYAKDLAAAFIGLEGELDPDKYTKALQAVAEGGKALFDTRPDAMSQTGSGQQKAADGVAEVFGNDVVVEDIGDEPLNLSDLSDL